MLGMPVDAWVLLFFAVGLGLTLEVTFFRARRRRGATPDVGGRGTGGNDGGGGE